MNRGGMNRRNWLTKAGLLTLTTRAGGWQMRAASSAPSLPARDEFPITGTQTCLDNSRWHPIGNGSMKAIQQYVDFKARGTPGVSTGGQQGKVKEMFAQLINARPSKSVLSPAQRSGRI